MEAPVQATAAITVKAPRTGCRDVARPGATPEVHRAPGEGHGRRRRMLALGREWSCRDTGRVGRAGHRRRSRRPDVLAVHAGRLRADLGNRVVGTSAWRTRDGG